MSKQIKWKNAVIPVKLIDTFDGNYKIKTELGLKMFRASVKSFGRAGTVILNPKKGGRYDLIDGHSRLEDALKHKEKKVNASLPNRPLTQKEFVEMNAIFDKAKASVVDEERVKKELGTNKDFFKKYGMEIPLELLSNIGAVASSEDLEYPEEGKGKDKKGKAVEAADIRQVQLFYPAKQEEEFKRIAESLRKKYKVTNISDAVLRAIKSIK